LGNILYGYYKVSNRTTKRINGINFNTLIKK
jgi:hypothetical protein